MLEVCQLKQGLKPKSNQKAAFNERRLSFNRQNPRSFHSSFVMQEEFEPEITKAVQCNIPLGETSLDAYMMPSGEKRLGIEGTSNALGYTDRWFYNRTNRPSKWLSGLQGKGFIGISSTIA